VDEIIELFQRGLSVREVARQTGRPFATVRLYLIRKGAYQVRHKYVSEGTALCRGCGTRKPIEEFPAIYGGKYQCRLCLAVACQASALKKQGGSLREYERLFEEQGGKCAICGRPDGP